MCESQDVFEKNSKPYILLGPGLHFGMITVWYGLYSWELLAIGKMGQPPSTCFHFPILFPRLLGTVGSPTEVPESCVGVLLALKDFVCVRKFTKSFAKISWPGMGDCTL